MKLSKDAMKYLEYVSQQTNTPVETVVESALNFVAHISSMPPEDQEIIKSLVEVHCQLDTETKDTKLTE